MAGAGTGAQGAAIAGGRIGLYSLDPPDISLVGGLEHDFYFPIQLGMSSSQLTFIFFRGVQRTNQFHEDWIGSILHCFLCSDF